MFTARGVSFYDQPSENAKSGKPKREKEKHHEWRYARRFGGSLTSTDMPRLGTIGFEGRFDYAAIGTVSNVASRLCDEAKPGQILISPRVLMAVKDAVTVEPVGEFELKGIRRPIAAYNVLAVAQPS